MFDSLKGIKPARDVRERAESTLEKLVKLGDTVREEYAGRVSGVGVVWVNEHDNIYLPMYQSLSSTLPDYAEQDLQDLLIAKANNNYREKEAQVLGMYTGVLLHVLSERYEKEGKKAVFTFDLHEQELDYLFLFAKRAGEVTVRNVKGKYTCSLLASFGGKAEKLVIERNEGDWAASLAGRDKGNVGTLIVNGNRGYGAASGAGRGYGNVGTLIVKENEGDRAASLAGDYGGNVGTLIVNGNRGDEAASGAGSIDGNVGTLIVKENKGDRAASGAGSNGGSVGTLIVRGNKGNLAASGAGSYNGNVGTLIVRDNEGHDAASGAGSDGGKVGTLAFYKEGTNAGENANAKRIITGRRALALYKRLENKLQNTSSQKRNWIEKVYRELRRALP